jgi:hypothetical protein
MNQWNGYYKVIQGRLGIHMRWLDFKDLEHKKEAKIKQILYLMHMATCSIVQNHIASA